MLGYPGIGLGMLSAVEQSRDSMVWEAGSEEIRAVKNTSWARRRWRGLGAALEVPAQEKRHGGESRGAAGLKQSGGDWSCCDRSGF